jgi:hypothetical protein
MFLGMQQQYLPLAAASAMPMTYMFAPMMHPYFIPNASLSSGVSMNLPSQTPPTNTSTDVTNNTSTSGSVFTNGAFSADTDGKG